MLIMGFFEDPAEVGRYDLATLMASLLLIVINSLGYIFTPTASHLCGKGLLEAARQSYVVSTKWGYILTVPILFMLMLCPIPLVELLYGTEYIGIILAMQIVAAGYMVNTITGPNYHMLIATNNTKVITQTFLLNAVSNVLLCLLLIPLYGIVGAALAISISSGLANLLLSIRLYKYLGIHPLTRNYVLSIVSSVILLAAFYSVLHYASIQLSIFSSIVSMAIYMSVYLGSLLLLRTIDQEDLTVIAGIESKIGITVTPLIARYMH
jgi:O-antigen/teichoic acid export membrane protein